MASLTPAILADRLRGLADRIDPPELTWEGEVDAGRLKQGLETMTAYVQATGRLVVSPTPAPDPPDTSKF